MFVLSCVQMVVMLYGSTIKEDGRLLFVFYVSTMLVIYAVGFIAGIVSARSDVNLYEESVIKRWVDKQNGSLVNHSAYGTFPVAMPSSSGKDNSREVAC